MSYTTCGSDELGQPDRLQPEEESLGWCRLAKIVTFVGGVYVSSFVCTNFTIFSAGRILSDIPGMTKESLGTCQSMFWIGQMAAAGLIMPHLDAWGRKQPTFFLLLLSLGAAILVTYATTVWLFGAGLFFLGVFYSPSSLTAAIWSQENVPPSRRSTVLVIANVGYSAGSTLMAVACMYTKDWSWRDETRLWFSPLLVIMIVGPFVTGEPSRAKTDDQQDEVSFTAQTRALFFSHLWRNTVGTLLCWTACSLSFYGLNYSAGNISDDLYTNMALFGLVDIVSYFLPLPIMESLGNVKSQILGFGGASIALLCDCFANKKSMGAFIWALIGRFFVNLAFTTVYALIVDCFPEERRAAAMGFANLFGSLGSTVAPYTILLPFQATSIILSAVTGAAAMATTLLEVGMSVKQPLPQCVTLPSSHARLSLSSDSQKNQD